MKHTLIAVVALVLCACSSLSGRDQAAMEQAADATGLSHWPGDYDNHAQVWQAQQDKLALPPVHVRHEIVKVPDTVNQWDWHLSMRADKNRLIKARWRYTLRQLDDGTLLLTPQRSLPVLKGQPTQWASLAPCAMRGNRNSAHRLTFIADNAACSAVLPGLGSAAALLPLRMTFAGQWLDVATYADQARGDKAIEHAMRVRWLNGWVAINGGGPDAKADNTDWHMHHDLHIGDQGGTAAIRWRDGQTSGYSLKLERLNYRQRNTRVLKLSVVRDSDGDTVAYAWTDPDARQIGLNLGWVQAGLSLQQADTSR